MVIITFKTLLIEKVGYHLPGNSGAARMRTEEVMANLLRFFLVLSINFQLLKE